MSKTKLERQFLVAANQAFKEGLDKHAMKMKGGIWRSSQIFSYSSKDNLIDFSKNLCNWIHENYPDVKKIKEISVEMLNEFLRYKDTYVSQNTISAYISHIRKWERVIFGSFKVKVHWSKGLERPGPISKEEKEIKRIQQMNREDFNKIRELSGDSRSKATVAIEISARIGARVSGAVALRVQDISPDNSGRWGFGKVYLKEKGARERYVDIKNEEDRTYLMEQMAGRKDDERLVDIKKDSANKQLNRIMEKLGIKHKYPDTGFHSIRKMWAQETWDMCRKSGMGWEETKRYLNRQLGHSSDRDIGLLSIYVKKMCIFCSKQTL